MNVNFNTINNKFMNYMEEIHFTDLARPVEDYILGFLLNNKFDKRTLKEKNIEEGDIVHIGKQYSCPLGVVSRIFDENKAFCEFRTGGCCIYAANLALKTKKREIIITPPTGTVDAFIVDHNNKTSPINFGQNINSTNENK